MEQYAAESGGATIGDGSDPGSLLRDLRTARQLSLSRLAERAGLSKGTLSNWEAGRFQPRLPELNALLDALDASRPERTRLLTAINAPRAVRTLRAQSEAEASSLIQTVGHAPAIGDLLRALRCRRGLSREQVAAALRVNLSTVRRWERSEAALPPERHAEICLLLQATPQEQAILTERRCWLGNSAAPQSLDALEEQAHCLRNLAHGGETALADLAFLTLESQIWPYIERDASGARQVLGLAYSNHADALEMSGRWREVRQYAGRALELARGGSGSENWLIIAARSLAWASVPEGHPDAARRRLESLQMWRGLSDAPTYQAVLLRDLAQYAAEAGQHEAAANWIARAATVCERLGPFDTRATRHIRAHTLLLAGRAAEALPLLPRNEQPDETLQTYLETMQWVRALTALNERAEAHARLNRVYALCRQHNMPTTAADALARQL